jgi:hypothetical protein
LRSGQAGQSGGEKPRGPLAGRHAHDPIALIAEGRAPAVDGGGGLGHALGHRQQILSPPSQPMASGSALEEAHAERLFELAQAPDDRGLAEVQRAGGAPQAAGLGHGEKDAQIVPLHADRLATPRVRPVLRIRSGVIHG